jgi:hypothetical protein
MKHSWILTLAMLASTACCEEQNDRFTQTTPTGFTSTAVMVNGTMVGEVMRENGTLAANALVRIGSKHATNDANGYFVLRNIPLHQKVAVVHADVPGYGHTAPLIYPPLNHTRYTTLTLTERHVFRQFDGALGSTVTLAEGASVPFTPQAVATAGGTPFGESTALTGRWLDPTAPGAQAMMPEYMPGIYKQNEAVSLRAISTAAVELTRTNGTPPTSG